MVTDISKQGNQVGLKQGDEPIICYPANRIKRTFDADVLVLTIEGEANVRIDLSNLTVTGETVNNADDALTKLNAVFLDAGGNGGTTTAGRFGAIKIVTSDSRIVVNRAITFDSQDELILVDTNDLNPESNPGNQIDRAVQLPDATQFYDGETGIGRIIGVGYYSNTSTGQLIVQQGLGDNGTIQNYNDGTFTDTLNINNFGNIGARVFWQANEMGTWSMIQC